MTMPNTEFDTSTPLAISQGSATFYGGKTVVAGSSLTWPAASTLGDAGSSGAILNSVSACPSGTFTGIGFKVGGTASDSFTQDFDANNNFVNVTSITGGSVTGASFSFYLYGSGSTVSAYSQLLSPGINCVQTDPGGIVVTLTSTSTTPDSAATATQAAGSILTCGAKIAFKCSSRVDEAASTVVVIPTTNGPSFQSGSNLPIYLSDSQGQGIVEITDPWYRGLWGVYAARGDIQPISDSTTVSYQTTSTVQAADTVPALVCYDNCPVGITDAESKSPSAALSMYPIMRTLMQVTVNSAGKCAAAITAANAGKGCGM